MAQFPIAPPPGPNSKNVFPVPPSREKQALLARQVAEEMCEDGIDAMYSDHIPSGAIPLQGRPLQGRTEDLNARSYRKRFAAGNATRPQLWSINTTRGMRYFTPRHYISPSKVPGQVTISRIPGPGSNEIARDLTTNES